jgi:AraC-like DNA-binding protein
MTTTSFTTATGMGPLPRLLETAQGTRAVERVFRAEGLPLWLAHNQSGKLPLRSMMGLFERSAREIGDDLFGLNLGLAMQPEDYGFVGRYIASAPTLSRMIQRSIRAVAYHTSGCEFTLRVVEDLAYWGFRAFDPFDIGRRHHADHVVPSVLCALARFLGPHWLPLRLELEYERPASWRMIEDWIEVPVIFGAITNSVVFDAQLLESTPPRQVPLKDVLSWQDLRRFAMQKPPATNVDAAREVVRLRLMDATVDIEGTAKLLGIGLRTLQRQLAEENLTYRDLVLQLRMQRAADLLRESSEPVTSIAFSLGYSDVASFTRAFKQWAGDPPSHYRRPISTP